MIKPNVHDHIGFVPEHDNDAFGFVDPAQVLCACHLIPAFAYDKTLAFYNLLQLGMALMAIGLTTMYQGKMSYLCPHIPFNK